MKINLIAIGNKMPSWVNTGFLEYQKRMTQEVSLHLIEIPAIKRSKNTNAETIIEQEGQLLLNSIPKNNDVVVLDVKGQNWSTEKLAEKLSQWKMSGRDISLLIGGPEGLSKACLDRATIHWSLSKLTFPHPLVRVIVAEQLYRAFTVIKGHPYHRA